MEQILPTDEYSEFEDRVYLNPQPTVDRTNSFIDSYRSAQAANNEQIAAQTAALGTETPSNLGGLNTGTDYWSVRYQAPQSASAVANLRATAQAAALNQALENEQAIWKKRYNDAYRAYQKRSWDKQNQTTGPYVMAEGDDPEEESTTPEGANEISVSGVAGSYTVVDAAGNLHIVDMDTGEEQIIPPSEGVRNVTSAAGLGGGEMRTLPNGRTVWVKPGYSFVQEGSRYYLVDQSTGARFEVGR